MPPPAVEHLASADFIRHLRDGGPQALQPESLPPVDAGWIGEDPADTVRNLVGALCQHRFGSGVFVEKVEGSPETARGREYLVTLSLANRTVLGSCLSAQIQNFDRDTTTLLEALREVNGWNQPVYKLKVQTPGAESELRVPEDLWKCDIFPCRVTWVNGTSRYDKYLSRIPDTTVWKLADTEKNYGHQPRLTERQKDLRITIEPSQIVSVYIIIDRRSHGMLKSAREAIRSGREGANESGVADDDEGDEEDVDDSDYTDEAEDLDTQSIQQSNDADTAGVSTTLRAC